VQLNNIELSAFIDGEMEKNPRLQCKDGEAADCDPLASDSALARNADMP